MAPINLPDGTEVSEVILPDGASASEVIAPDGTTVFGAIPDSVVLHSVATDYDGSKIVSKVGPNIIDQNGSPSKTSVSANGNTFDVIETNSSNNEWLKTTDGINISADKQAVIYTVRHDAPNTSGDNYYIDNSTGDDSTHLHDPGSNHRLLTNSSAFSSSGPDGDFHTFCAEFVDFSGTPESFLLRDGSQIIQNQDSWTKYDDLAISAKGDGSLGFADRSWAEIVMLEGHTTLERDSEISRQRNKYGT